MNYSQTMRLIWIDGMLASVGRVRRIDICQMFLISTPQASLDLRAYCNAFPTGVKYDATIKCYKRVGIDNLFDDDALDAVAEAAEQVRHWACIQFVDCERTTKHKGMNNETL